MLFTFNLSMVQDLINEKGLQPFRMYHDHASITLHKRLKAFLILA